MSIQKIPSKQDRIKELIDPVAENLKLTPELVSKAKELIDDFFKVKSQLPTRRHYQEETFKHFAAAAIYLAGLDVKKPLTTEEISWATLSDPKSLTNIKVDIRKALGISETPLNVSECLDFYLQRTGFQREAVQWAKGALQKFFDEQGRTLKEFEGNEDLIVIAVIFATARLQKLGRTQTEICEICKINPNILYHGRRNKLQKCMGLLNS